MTRSVLAWVGRGFGLLAGGYLGYVALRGSRLLLRPTVAELLPELPSSPADPDDLGLAYEDVRFTADDGVTLAGWLIPAGRETRAVVILLHGFSGNRLPELAAFVPWLQPRYHVLLFDFRGHGASDRGMVTLGAFERRDVAAAVRFVQSRGLGPVALAGISMGASTAILAAPELPVAAVVADAAFAELHHPIANRLRELRYPLAELGARAIVATASLRAKTRFPSPLRAVSRIAPRPLLLIAPSDDRLIEPSQSHRLYAAAGEPKELFDVPGAAHGDALLVAGAAYQARVLDFLARHLDPVEAKPGHREPAGQRL